MFTGVNMETKGGLRKCALNRNTQLAITHVQGCQQTRDLSLRVLRLVNTKENERGNQQEGARGGR